MDKYYRVGNKVDDLPLYVLAATPQAARDVVEALTGPIPDKLITIEEIRPGDVPEGEDVLGAEETPS